MQLLAASLLLAAGLTAQSTLVSPFVRDYWLNSLDGGVYFDLVVRHELQLDRIDLDMFSQANVQGTVEVWVRPGGWSGHVEGSGDWVRAATAAVTSLGWYQPAPCVLSAPIGLPPGEYGIALRVQNLMPAYMHSLTPQSFGNADVTVGAGSAALQFLGSAPYTWRLFSGALHYRTGGGPFRVATVEPFGAGCHQGARSFYETFAPGSFDLQGQRLLLTPNGAGGYDVARSAAAPIVLPQGAANLGLSRHGAAFVTMPAPLTFPGGTTPMLRVHADGHVALTDRGLLTAVPAQPTPQALLAEAQVALLCMDLAPQGNDNVYAVTDAVTGTTTIVWWNVPAHGAAVSGNTFALTVRTDGTLELDFGTAQNPTLSCLCGFGAAPSARDPGPRDLSLANSFATQSDHPGLGLTASGRPVPGTVTTLTVVDGPVPAGLTALLLGWDRLSVPLPLAAFGAAGCHLHVDPSGATMLALGTASMLALPLPNDARLLGLTCHAQAAAWPTAAVTTAGLVTSNGLTLAVGGV